MPKKKKKKTLDDVNKMVDEMEEREEEKNVFITSIIAERIGDISALTPATVTGLPQLKRTQKDIALIISELERVQNEQIKAIKEIVRTSAEVTYNTTQYALKQSENAPQLPTLSENREVEKVIEQAEKQAVDNFKNEYRTQAFMLRDRTNPKNLIPTSLSKAYQAAVDEATQTIITSGERWAKEGKSTNYTTVMRQTVKQLADSGVRVVVVRKDGTETNKVAYESERLRYHTQRLDTAVKRNVLDSVRMVNQSVQNKVGEQIGADGVEITVHRYPAEDHAPVQGHQFTNEEFAKMQNGEDCKDVQGRTYAGFQRPIGMWNCRHFTFSIICGVFPQTYNDEQLADILKENDKGYTLPNGKHLTMYQCTQQQRKMETEIRYAKEGKITAEKAGDSQLADEFQARVVELLNDYRAFSNACGLSIKPKNIFVQGYKQ